MSDSWLAELSELIRIPSISADPAHAPDVRAAGEWLAGFLRRAGAEGGVVDWNGQPLVVATLPASRDAAAKPTVLCYGHFDVQGVEPLELWESDPFALEVRGDWVYGRGVADDKGGLYMLAKAAQELAAAGELPVNVRFVCDGEEEIFGTTVVEYLRADPEPPDACVIYDAGMIAPDLPAFGLGTRGSLVGAVSLRSGVSDLHSGGYGGAAMNAIHALHAVLAAVLPRDGAVPEPLRAGVVPPSAEERAEVARLAAGADRLAAVGAPPADAAAAAEFYERVWFAPSVEVTGIAGGAHVAQQSIVPSHAEARVSMRLAAGQDPDAIRAVAERLMRAAAPTGCRLDVAWSSAVSASLFAAGAPAIQLALDAFERVCGARPVLQRVGGTLPIMPALAAAGIDTVLTGFALPASRVHAPNERMLTSAFPQGIAAAKELFRVWAALSR